MNLFGLTLARNWKQQTTEQLSASIISQNKMTKMTLMELFLQASASGYDAEEDELSGAYALMNGEYVVDIKEELGRGNAKAVSLLVNAGKKHTGWSKVTEGAVTAVIANNMIVPTADEVTAELEMVGFAWSEDADGRGGSAWVMSEDFV